MRIANLMIASILSVGLSAGAPVLSGIQLIGASPALASDSKDKGSHDRPHHDRLAQERASRDAADRYDSAKDKSSNDSHPETSSLY